MNVESQMQEHRRTSQVSRAFNTGSLKITARYRGKGKPERKGERTMVKGTDGRGGQKESKSEKGNHDPFPIKRVNICRHFS